MQLFFDPALNLKSVDFEPFGFTLNQEESWHCTKVMRMHPGELICITNGKGYLFHGLIKIIGPKGCLIDITEMRYQQPRDYRIHIAVAPVKNMTRFEWFLEKATELGIDVITPLISAHSEKISVRTDRLNKIITSAMKQSQGVYYPLLNEPTSLHEFIRKQEAGQKFIGWCGTTQEPLLSEVCQPTQDTIILIGPEGDFSAEEVQQAKAMGYKAISLGKSRLRTETAALIASAAVHFVNRSI